MNFLASFDNSFGNRTGEILNLQNIYDYVIQPLMSYDFNCITICNSIKLSQTSILDKLLEVQKELGQGRKIRSNYYLDNNQILKYVGYKIPN